MIRALSVWWDGAVVGALRLDQHGDLSFAYDPAWIDNPARPAISASLPKRPEPFNRRQTRPFFAGLLPEEGQREGVARALGVSEANDFRLLEKLGGDVAGALTLWPEGEIPPQPPAGLAKALDEAEVADILAALPRRPLLAGREGLRLSLAGAQAKVPVVLSDGQIALPAPGQPTTHIIKPPMAAFADSTANEAFSMRLAAAVGLNVAPVELRSAENHPYLLVERYDREPLPGGGVRRLHQEDFCQALGYAPEHKYASDGGPGFRDCFGLIREVCTSPAPAVLGLTDAAIFNVILGNADAHSKNFSLLFNREGVTLAPLYDLLCTAAYPDVAVNLAMRIAKRATLEDFRPDTWELFARDMGVGVPYVRRRVRILAEAALREAATVADTLAAAAAPRHQIQTFVEIVAARATRLIAP